MAAGQRRILMWATPRTLSTAFTRAMLARDSCKLINEPSIKTFYMSTDRDICLVDSDFWGSQRPAGWPGEEELPLPGCSWKDLGEELSGPYDGFKVVFAKDMAHRFKTPLDSGIMDDIIPHDYVHVFITRDPERSIPSTLQSLEIMPLNNVQLAMDGRYRGRKKGKVIHECSWQEQKRIYDWVVQTKGYKPLVIDAGDLQKDPESTLRRFCEFVQIDYQDSMVHWLPLTNEQKQHFDFFGEFFAVALGSGGFLASTPKKTVQHPEYAELLDETIANAMAVYNEFKGCEADKCAL